MNAKSALSPFIALAVAASGCGDDDSQSGSEPVFAVGLSVFGENLADGPTTFIALVDDLAEGQADLGNAIETPGAGNLWGVSGSGEFYLTNGIDLTLTKYRIEDGRAVQAGRLGLSGVLSSALFGEVLIFDGPSRGHLVVPLSGVVVEIDLDAMEIVTSRDATSLRDPTQPTRVGVGVYSDGLYVFPTVATDEVQETVSAISQLVFFDPSTGTFEVRESPCGGLGYTMEGENGDLYFSTGPWTASVHALDESRAPEPCIVRVPRGTREPDPNVIRLNGITGLPTGGLIPRGGSSAYVRTLNTTAIPLTSDLLAAQLLGSPGWNTWEINLDRPDEASVTERELVVGGISIFEVDGVFYENDSAPDFSSTTLVRSTGADAPAEALSTPGIPFAVVRLQ